MTIRIKLTKSQVFDLRDYLDRVNATAALGTPGMLVAQLRRDTHHDCWWLIPAFLEHEHAAVISEKGTQQIPGPTKPGLHFAVDMPAPTSAVSEGSKP